VLQSVGFLDLPELAVLAVFAVLFTLSPLRFFLAFDLSQVKKQI
jgi:hypothetical protein